MIATEDWFLFRKWRQVCTGLRQPLVYISVLTLQGEVLTGSTNPCISPILPLPTSCYSTNHQTALRQCSFSYSVLSNVIPLCVYVCIYVGDGGKKGRLVKLYRDLGLGQNWKEQNKKGSRDYSWTDFLKLQLVSFLAGESYYIKWLKLLSFHLCWLGSSPGTWTYIWCSGWFRRQPGSLSKTIGIIGNPG